MVKGTKGNSTKKTSNQGTEQKSKRTSSRVVIHPAPATVADVKRRPKVEMTGTTGAEKLKLVADIVGSIIGEPIHNTEVPAVAGPVMAVDEAEPLPEEEPQEEAEEEKLTADVGAPVDIDFSRLRFLAETSAVAEQLLNASHTTESLK